MIRITRVLPLLTLASLLAGLMLPGLPAQEAAPVVPEKNDPGPFYGFWEFQEPAGDTCVVIIKRGGRLSCFWAGTATRAIQKGTWERDGAQLTARWETGYMEVFRMIGENAIERDTYNPGDSLLESPSLTIRGVRVDSRIPGNLTVQAEGERPEAPEDVPDPQAAPALPMRNAFIGFWKVEQSGGGLLGFGGGGEPHFYLHLERSGYASVALRNWEGDKAVRGRWGVEGDRAVITWPNNRRDLLEPKPNGGYRLATYRPKQDLEDQPQDRSAALKVAAAEANRFFDAGNFQRLTVEDIRGTWYPVDTEDNDEYLSVEGWGNAYRFPAADGSPGTDPGKWRLQNDRVLITWVDGTKDVIRLTIQGFVRESYTAGEPFTGTPYRSVPILLRED